MRRFDVAIIGSGPSGSITAFKLAEAGYSVAIIEKEVLPRYKICGGGLVSRGKELLPFDLSEVIDAEFKEIDVYFTGKNTKLTAKREKAIISMVMRDKFDQLIVNQSVKLGVTLIEDFKVNQLIFGKLIGIKSADKEIEAKYVIAADGALSPIAKLAGWKTDTRKLIPAVEHEVSVSADDFSRLSKEARFDIDFIPNGYAWCFPKGNHLSIGVARFKRNKVNLKKYYIEYLEALGIKNVTSDVGYGFQIPVSPRSDGFSKNNVFLIGDAAGFADPITAEGISNAIYSGKLAAMSIIEADKLKIHPSILYHKNLKLNILKELKTANYFAKLFYNYPKIRNYFIFKAGDKFCNYLVDIFLGDKKYPTNILKSITKLIRKSVFN